MVRLGSDLLLASPRLKGARVGVVCNHASLDRGFLHIVDRLTAAPDGALAAIFGPQHGFRSDVQDNMIETPHANDPGRRVPIYSLYSETREPTAEMLSGIDVLVIDLQDVGGRPPHLHLHLHDGQLHARLRAASHPGHRVRPAESDRRRGRRRRSPRAWIRVIRRSVPDPDAPRDGDWGAGPALPPGPLHPRLTPR